MLLRWLKLFVSHDMCFLLTSVSCRAISREAARRRRRVESDVFGDLSRLLPLHPSIQSHLDKPTVIRLTLSYIRMHTVLKGAIITHINEGFQKSMSLCTSYILHLRMCKTLILNMFLKDTYRERFCMNPKVMRLCMKQYNLSTYRPNLL